MKRNLNNYNHARKVPSSRTLPSFDSSSSSSSSSSFCSLVPSFPPSSSFSVRASCAVRTMEIPAENDSVVSLGGHFDSLIVAASPSLSSSSSSSNYGSSSSSSLSCPSDRSSSSSLSSESSLFLSSKPARVKGFGSAIDRSTAVSSENALSDSSSSKKRGDVSPPSSSSSSSCSCESPCSPSSLVSISSSSCSAPIWIRDPHKMKINKDLPYAARRSNNHSPSFLERKSQFLEEDADVDDLDVMEIPSRSLNSSSSSSSSASSPASWWRGYEWGSARSIASDNGGRMTPHDHDQEGLFLCDEDLQDHDCEPTPLSL